MDLVTNGSIITGALDYVNGRAKKLASAESDTISNNIKLNDEEEEGSQSEPSAEDKTTNDVF